MKQVEAVDLMRVIWRRLWLILLIVGVTVGLLIFRARVADPVYAADVTLMINTPDREDVAVTDEYTFTSDRDLITTAVNTFVEIAQYEEVKTRTKNELGIEGDYEVKVDAEIGADLIYVTVRADDAELTQKLANAHARNAIAYLGELRARPSTQGLNYFNSELEAAGQDLTDAENTMAAFLTEHDIVVSLEDEIRLQRDVLAELELLQARNQVPRSSTSETMSSVASDSRAIQTMIGEKRERLNELVQLRPEYNLLKGDIERAQQRYNRLSSRLTETELRESFSSQVLFIQMIEPASVPDAPENQTARTLILGFIASLGLGILAAFVLDYTRATW